MFGFIRFIITSCLVIGFCSLSINDRPIFNYLYRYTRVIVAPVQKSAQDFIKLGYHRTLDFSRQFFNNNLPSTDSLDYQMSAPERDEVDYSDDDKKKLDKIFK